MMTFANEQERKAYFRQAVRRSRAKKKGLIDAEALASGRLIKVNLPTGQRLEIRMVEPEQEVVRS